MLPGLGSCTGWKGSGFGTERALGSRFLPQVEGFRVSDGTCSHVSVLAPGRRVLGLRREVLSGFGSGPGWKGLGFGTEGASGSRFLPWVEGFRVRDGRCFRVPVHTPGGRV